MKTTKIGKHTIPVFDSIEGALGSLDIDPNKVEITWPQFDRPANESPPEAFPLHFPGTAPNDWAKWLMQHDPETLYKWGLRRWNDPNEPDEDGEFEGGTLWLLPAEVYKSLPAGLDIVDVCNRHQVFQPSVSPGGCRLGLLGFGFIKSETE